VVLGDWRPRENLGGLSLTALHGYSASVGTLFKGDGSQVDMAATGAAMRFFAGGGYSTAEDAGFANVAIPGQRTSLAEGPDGTVYFAEGLRRVRALRPDGSVATVAALGATDRRALWPSSVALLPLPRTRRATSTSPTVATTEFER
jgi:hypothetical protein